MQLGSCSGTACGDIGIIDRGKRLRGAPCRVVRRIHFDDVPGEGEHPLAGLACPDDAAEVVRRILVYGNQSVSSIEGSAAQTDIPTNS